VLRNSPIIGFVPTTDAERSRAFYVDVLKLDFVSDDQFALVVRTQSSMIRIAKTENFTPVPYTVLGWEVSAIEEQVQALSAAGVSFERYPYLPQGELGIWTTPDGSKVAWFKDPDGNLLSLSQH
jgi:catechol 2,3-dioxygenase-like lactoylglutathione lyase family enzyme